jgi:hypothetical protein
VLLLHVLIERGVVILLDLLGDLVAPALSPLARSAFILSVSFSLDFSNSASR